MTSMNATAPQRPAAHTEEALVSAILSGELAPGSALPGERDLAVKLGVTRPTLREALQRLERDGWLTIRQGKPTVVNDYLHDGGLNVLSALVRYQRPLPPDFIPNLLAVRLCMAPDYARGAVASQPDRICGVLRRCPEVGESARAFASYDWELHRALTRWCGNPVYCFILNGFSGFYEEMAVCYFEPEKSRTASHRYYLDLLAAAEAGDASGAESLTRSMMARSIELWSQAERSRAAEG
jgi:GntR family negative regulator for fad regulon and positive regulator of fabA